MQLNNLKKIKGNQTKGKKVGRGIGSGKGGHTTGKGTKGQKSRGGNSLPFGFEGGQVPLHKKLPKIGGFRNKASREIASVSLVHLNKFDDGVEVMPASLVEVGILKRLPKHGVKLLAKGALEKKLTLVGFLASKGAKTLIEESGSIIKDNA